MSTPRLQDILLRFLDRRLNTPAHTRVGTILVIVGVAGIYLAGAFTGGAEVTFDFNFLKGRLTASDTTSNTAYIVGILCLGYGVYLLHTNVFSSKARRKDAKLKLVKALQSDAPPVEVQVLFNEAYGINTGVLEIRWLMSRNNPDLSVYDFARCRDWLVLKDGSLEVVSTSGIGRLPWLARLYWAFASVVIGAYCAIHFPFFGGMPQHLVPSLWVTFALALPPLVVIVRLMWKYSSFERLAKELGVVS